MKLKNYPLQGKIMIILLTFNHLKITKENDGIAIDISRVKLVNL